MSDARSNPFAAALVGLSGKLSGMQEAGSSSHPRDPCAKTACAALVESGRTVLPLLLEFLVLSLEDSTKLLEAQLHVPFTPVSEGREVAPGIF